jgi:hypothetical protein
MFPLLVRVLFQALAAPRVLQNLPFRDMLSSSGFSGQQVNTGPETAAPEGVRQKKTTAQHHDRPRETVASQTRIIMISGEPHSEGACAHSL